MRGKRRSSWVNAAFSDHGGFSPRSRNAELTQRSSQKTDLIKGRWTLCSIDPFLADGLMAMNENDGGSAYPPNPDVKFGPCLIAGFHALTDIRPSYWNAYKAESGATFSIDMVRLKLSFINGKGEWLSTHLPMSRLDETCRIGRLIIFR